MILGDPVICWVILVFQIWDEKEHIGCDMFGDEENTCMQRMHVDFSQWYLKSMARFPEIPCAASALIPTTRSYCNLRCFQIGWIMQWICESQTGWFSTIFNRYVSFDMMIFAVALQNAYAVSKNILTKK